MAAICVFCSSSTAIDPTHVELATEMGAELARRGHHLVSGGGRSAMMGAVAQAARSHGAETYGVIPQVLVDQEAADYDCTELTITTTMRERKEKMGALSDAFIILPGGIGTLEELFDVWVGRTLQFHHKPVVVCDPAGVYPPLQAFFEQLTESGFIRAHASKQLTWTTSVQTALGQVEHAIGAQS